MCALFRLWLLVGLGSYGVLAAASLSAAQESEGDLRPALPTARTIVDTNNPWHFRNNVNSGSQSLSADGRWLLMGGQGLMLWDLSERTAGQPRTLPVGQVNVYNAAVALSPDGKTAAFVPMYHGTDMAVRFFDTTSSKQIREIDNDQQILGLAFAPDGRHLAVAAQQRLELWNAEDGEEIRVFSAAPNSNFRRLTFSPDGKMLAALGNDPDTVNIWETTSGKERASVHFGPQATPLAGGRKPRVRAVVPVNNANNNATLALAFSADCRLLAVSKQDLAIHLWDLQANRELPPLTGYRGQVIALAFSPDGKELIGVDSEGTRLSWRMATLRRNCNIRLTPLDDADFADLWNELADTDLFRAYRARRHLAADAKRALPLLSRHLEPVPAGDTARIQQLVNDLSSANAGTRRKAMTELRAKHGEAALGALLQLGGGNVAMGAVNGPPGMIMMKGGVNSQAAMLLLQKLQMQYDTPERQRDVMAVHVLEEIGTPEARQILMKLSKGAAGVPLTTEAKAALDRLATAKGGKPRQAKPEQLWTDLGSDDAVVAFKAMCSLAAAPEQAAALMGKELKPVSVIQDKEIAVLLDDLNSDDFKIRERATEALAKISEQALPAMKKALGGPIPLEARKRLERLLEQITGKTSAPLMRGLRAVEVLEHSGTSESKQILVALAGGAPQAQLTLEAKASLQRLARQ
ncbi:MAG TPA: hypothetical protein VH592_18590 [Gemmataceae bacterium]|jgi:hypothetical protein